MTDDKFVVTIGGHMYNAEIYDNEKDAIDSVTLAFGGVKDKNGVIWRLVPHIYLMREIKAVRVGSEAQKKP